MDEVSEGYSGAAGSTQQARKMVKSSIAIVVVKIPLAERPAG